MKTLHGHTLIVRDEHALCEFNFSLVYSFTCLLTRMFRSEAWVGSVVSANDLHPVVECSNKGLCDRKTGECQCFTNYEGTLYALAHPCVIHTHLISLRYCM